MLTFCINSTRGRGGIFFLIVGGFYSEVALQKREAEGTVRTKHQLNLDPTPELNMLCDILFIGRCVVFIEATFGHSLRPGAVRGIAPRRGREEIGESCGRTRPRPHALAIVGGFYGNF